MEKRVVAIMYLAALGVTACASSGDRSSGSPPIVRSSQTPTEAPEPTQRRQAAVLGVPITQCFSEGGREARIKYPAGWSSRVSRAETEDELLGGAASVRTDGDVEPVTAVSFNYPAAALSPPIEAICEIKFDVSRRGMPSRVVAACSNDLFVPEATRAVSAARFKPVRINGDIALGINVVYQMKFCLSDEVHQKGTGVG